MMKKLLVVLVFVVFAFNANSQWYQKYGVTNINDLSEEQLQFSLHKAETNLKTGKILTFTGLGASLVGAIIAANATTGIFNRNIDETFNQYAYGSILMLGGMGAMAVGIPFWIVGASRRNQIEVALIKFSYSSYLGNYQPPNLNYKQPITIGLSLKVNF